MRRRGRRKNAPWGTSEAEYRHAGWNPRRRRNPLGCSMSRDEMFHELKHHGSRPRSHKQRVAIVLSQERRCGRRTNPRKSAPRSMGKRSIGGVGAGAILLGHLTEIVLSNGMKVNEGYLHKLYVAWLPSRKDLVVVKKVNARPGRVDADAIRRHRKFHGSAPKKAATYDLPERRGRQTQVGLIESLTYVVPNDVDSPEKANISWFHKFGDHGESGHGSVEEGEDKKYPQKYMPMLLTDDAGNLTIKRRPGNKYKVTDWIFW
jgi:hypothetical protein